MRDERPGLGPEETVRQRLIRELDGASLTARQLAGMLGQAERLIEDHLAHVMRTVARDRTKRFVLEPSACLACGYVFRERTRLTRPSRCPRCRSEDITPPRYGIRPTQDASR